MENTEIATDTDAEESRKTVTLSLDQILSDVNVNEAMAKLKGKPDSCGSDGVRLSELAAYWQLNKERIISAIQTGNYEPGIAVKKEVVSFGGRRRTIVLLNSVDRLLMRSVYQILEQSLDGLFSEHSFGYRPGKGVQDAVNCAISYMESGREWVAEIDIFHFFDSVPVDAMYDRLSERINNREVLSLLLAFLRMKTDEEGHIMVSERGLLQGSPLSPLFANLYLNDVDHKLELETESFIRYGDDINIYCPSYEEAARIRCITGDMLENIGLSMHQEKGGVFFGKRRRLLGYEFSERGSRLYAYRASRGKKQTYNRWQKTSIQYINRQYHLINDGVLNKRDFTVLFENKEGKKYLPVEAIQGLSIYADVTMTGDFLAFAGKNGLQISFIDRTGNKIGDFRPETLRRDYRTEVEQILLIKNESERLKLAKKLQNANVFNIRAALRYYERRGAGQQIKDAVAFMTGILIKLNEAKEVNQLMIYEAQARQRYYRCFNEILSDEVFRFISRSRRPPGDPLNAMISFGNTMLYQFFSREINRSGLDVRFGIVHNAARRSESLNLDLADLFKPVIVDRTIFTLVNRKMINPYQDFQEIGQGGVYMNESGKTKFIREFEQKVYHKIRIGGQRKSYYEIMKDEVRKLEDYFRKQEPYKPYKYVN